jgi:hypothetical protein
MGDSTCRPEEYTSCPGKRVSIQSVGVISACLSGPGVRGKSSVHAMVGDDSATIVSQTGALAVPDVIVMGHVVGLYHAGYAATP